MGSANRSRLRLLNSASVLPRSIAGSGRTRSTGGAPGITTPRVHDAREYRVGESEETHSAVGRSRGSEEGVEAVWAGPAQAKRGSPDDRRCRGDRSSGQALLPPPRGQQPRLRQVQEAADVADADAPAGGIVHAHHGVQFTFRAFTNKIRASGSMPSLGTDGDRYDNSMRESFWSSMSALSEK